MIFTCSYLKYDRTPIQIHCLLSHCNVNCLYALPAIMLVNYGNLKVNHLPMSEKPS